MKTEIINQDEETIIYKLTNTNLKTCIYKMECVPNNSVLFLPENGIIEPNETLFIICKKQENINFSKIYLNHKISKNIFKYFYFSKFKILISIFFFLIFIFYKKFF